jgi:hypothetical protein
VSVWALLSPVVSGGSTERLLAGVLAAVGGTLRVDAGPGYGTRITGAVPTA